MVVTAGTGYHSDEQIVCVPCVVVTTGTGYRSYTQCVCVPCMVVTTGTGTVQTHSVFVFRVWW